MERENGFYWVKYDGDWEVAQYNEARGTWNLLDWIEPITEKELQEINETRLIPPEK